MTYKTLRNKETKEFVQVYCGHLFTSSVPHLMPTTATMAELEMYFKEKAADPDTMDSLHTVELVDVELTIKQDYSDIA